MSPMKEKETGNWLEKISETLVEEMEPKNLWEWGEIDRSTPQRESTQSYQGETDDTQVLTPLQGKKHIQLLSFPILPLTKLAFTLVSKLDKF